MPATARESKRPFQPSITSFFGRPDRDDSDSLISISERPLSPPIPSHIQSSLLNVGMRVRKSVPEGYRVKDIDEPPLSMNTRALSPQTTSSRALSPAPVELMPFCGIMKVGGLVQQEDPRTSSFHGPLPEDIFGFGLPDSSQESNASTLSTDSMPTAAPTMASGKNKRRFEEGVDQDNCRIFDEDDFLASDSTAYPVSHTSMPKFDALRPLARPKTRKKDQHPGSGKDPTALDAGHRVPGSVSDLDDFEDASFLQPPSNPDRDLEMGGI